jgi:hypothetical protein
MAGIGERRSEYGAMVARPGRNRPLRRRWCDLEDNIQINLKAPGWGSMNWIDLAHERDRWWALLNLAASLKVPQNAGNFFTSWGPVSSSGRTLSHVGRSVGWSVVRSVGRLVADHGHPCLWPSISFCRIFMKFGNYTEFFFKLVRQRSPSWKTGYWVLLYLEAYTNFYPYKPRFLVDSVTGRDFHIMSISSWEFLENRRRKGRTFLWERNWSAFTRIRLNFMKLSRRRTSRWKQTQAITSPY